MADLNDYRLDRTAFSVVSLKDADDYSDVAYWETQPPAKRLEALEITRQVFYGDEAGDSQRLSRFFEVVKPARRQVSRDRRVQIGRASCRERVCYPV